MSVGAVCAHDGGLAWLGSTPQRPAGPWWAAWTDGSFKHAAPVGLPGAGPSSRTTSRWPSPSSPPSGGSFPAPTIGPPWPAGAVPTAPDRRSCFCHSGPTGCAEAGFDPVVQFFTSHGFAVAAVDTRGSTGYGRAYAAPVGRLGPGRCRRLRRGRPGPRREGVGRPPADGRGGERAPGGSPPCARWPAQGPSRRGVVVRGDRPGGPGRLHPRLRGPLQRPPGRSVARGGRGVPPPVTGQPGRGDGGVGPDPPGARRPGGAPDQATAMVDALAGGGCGSTISPSRASPTASGGPRPWPPASPPSSPSTRSSSARDRQGTAAGVPVAGKVDGRRQRRRRHAPPGAPGGSTWLTSDPGRRPSCPGGGRWAATPSSTSPRRSSPGRRPLLGHRPLPRLGGDGRRAVPRRRRRRHGVRPAPPSTGGCRRRGRHPQAHRRPAGPHRLPPPHRHPGPARPRGEPAGRRQRPQHEQPEVLVIEQAGARVAHGQDPYHAVVEHGRVVSAVPGEPTYESFFPYLPLMAVFGLPASAKHPIGLSDARVLFSVVTLLVVAVALLLCRGRGRGSCAPCSSWPSCPRPPCRWPPAVTTCRSWPSCCWPWCWPSGADPAGAGWCSAWCRP